MKFLTLIVFEKNKKKTDHFYRFSKFTATKRLTTLSFRTAGTRYNYVCYFFGFSTSTILRRVTVIFSIEIPQHIPAILPCLEPKIA